MLALRYFETGLNIEHDEKNILGILTRPEEKVVNFNPCVIFCHGYNGNRVEDNRLTVKLSRKLTEMGASSFRFDFLGAGVSDGFFHQWTLSDRVDQLINIQLHLKNHWEFTHFYFVGLSDGCRVVLEASIKMDNVDGISLFSPLLFTIDWSDFSTNSTPKIQLKRSKLHKKIMLSDRVGVWLHPKYFGKEAIDFLTIMKDLLKKVPIQTVFGGADPYVMSTRKELESIYHSKLEIHIVNGADHLFSSEEWMCTLFDKTITTIKRALYEVSK